MHTTRYKKLVNTLLLLACLWLLYFCIRFIKIDNNQTLENYLPTNSELVVKIKSKAVLKLFLSDILYQNKFDRKSISKFDIDTKNTSNKSSGIDIEKNVLFFYEKWEKKDIIGVFVHVFSKEKFLELNKNKNIFTSVNGEIGCLLRVFSEEDINTDALEKYAIDLLKSNRDKSYAKLNLQKLGTSNSMIDIYYSGNQSSLLNNLLLQVSVEKNTINLNGKATLNPALEKDSLPNYFVRNRNQEYLALNMGRLPDTLNYYLDAVLKEIHLNLPKIKKQNILFYGIGLDNIKGKMSIQPYFDAVFKFEDTLSISNKIAKVSELDSSIATITKDTITLGGTHYYFKQLSAQDVYVGTTPQPKIYTMPTPPIFYLRGRPESILNIDGNSWIADIARAIPQIRNSRDFLKEIKNFEIEAYGNKDLSVDIRGKIDFKAEEFVTLKVIDYILSFIKAPTLKDD